jgi:hypothetical protein
MSVEGAMILGYCRQHPTATVYDSTANAYRALKSLPRPTLDAPIEISVQRERPVSDSSRR